MEALGLQTVALALLGILSQFMFSVYEHRVKAGAEKVEDLATTYIVIYLQTHTQIQIDEIAKMVHIHIFWF